MPDEEFLTTEQAAELWHVHRETVRRWSRKKLIHTVKIGRRLLIPRSEIARLVAAGMAEDVTEDQDVSRSAARHDATGTPPEASTRSGGMQAAGRSLTPRIIG